MHLKQKINHDDMLKMKVYLADWQHKAHSSSDWLPGSLLQLNFTKQMADEHIMPVGKISRYVDLFQI